jgi:Protein of unknown function (DUF3247)
MASGAEHVYTDPSDIQRIEALIEDLPGNARVTITERDGTISTGIVAVIPGVQVFRDVDGNEGMNAVVRIEDPARSNVIHTIWLDQIVRVEHLDSVRLGAPES